MFLIYKKITHNNLWKDSTDISEWFRNIENKSEATFFQLDIIDFFPSISKEILIDGINNAKKYVEITDEQCQIILACRKTVLKNIYSIWIKT